MVAIKTTAPAKPPTTIKPNFRSSLLSNNKPIKTNKPNTIVIMLLTLGGPTSRLNTRIAGTLDNCKTGAKPNAKTKDKPTKTPFKTGFQLNAGSSVANKFFSKYKSNSWPAKAINNPIKLPNKPTAINSMVCKKAICFCDKPSTR